MILLRVRNFVLAVAALVVGLVVGAWGPRGELLRVRSELDELRQKQARCSRGTAAQGIRELLRAEPTAPDGGPERRPGRHARARAPEPDEAPAGGGAAPQAAPGGGTAPQTAEDAEKAAATALDARRAQARAALAEQADLDDAQLAEIDRITDEMNARLKKQVDELVADSVEHGDVDRRQMMDFAAESLDAVIAADDQLRATLPADVYAGVDDEAVDPFSYISGDTITGLSELQDMVAPDDGGAPP